MKRSSSSSDFQAKTAASMIEANLEERIKRLTDSCPTDAARQQFLAEIEGFDDLMKRYIHHVSRPIDWDKINPPHNDVVVNHRDLPRCNEDNKKLLLSKLVVLKLNGGLGTTMGCIGPKSVIEVHSGCSFLDLTVHQIQYLNKTHGCNVPLVLMNSFNTHEETNRIISAYENSGVTILTFNQHRYPRILKEGLLPLPKDYQGKIEDWFPPGHGDIYSSLVKSPIFEQLKRDGREYVFISNIDNLGATVDLDILNFIDQNKSQYIMEVTDKTRADIKGGTLIEYEGKAKLLELAQVPSDKVEEFKSIKKFKIFNTNNLWVNLASMERIVKEEKHKEMDVIVNNKTVEGKQCIQLETAAGAAMEYFEGALGINVPRSRFLPVKSTSDLFIVQSNLYSLKNGSLVKNPARPFPTIPLVKLGDEFSKVKDYSRRIQSIPDIIELDHLTVSGDVTFGTGVSLRGTVIIVANHGSRIDIPSGSILENKVVSGNLRILDH